MLHTGDVLDLIPADEVLTVPPPPPPAMPVIYEDTWLLAVDKPAGMPSQPGRSRRSGELTAQEHAVLQLAARDGRRTDVLLIHRLDRLTTGVLVFARSHQSAQALSRAWGTGHVHKRYLAIARGDPGPRPLILDQAIAPDTLTPGRFAAGRDGKAAVTELRRVAVMGGLSLVEAVPRTGRTHQVRVHLAQAGFPVAGDSLYGGGPGVPRPFLHAWRLALPHPSTGRTLRLEAPLPPDMRTFLIDRGVNLDHLPPD